MFRKIEVPRVLIVAIAITFLFLGIVIGAGASYNEETTGLWLSGYGIELTGSNGVELVNCSQVPDLVITTTVDC